MMIFIMINLNKYNNKQIKTDDTNYCVVDDNEDHNDKNNNNGNNNQNNNNNHDII